MIFTRNKMIGRSIDEIKIGEKLKLSEKMEDKDAFLYLGLTNDANPLYLQSEYVSLTPFEKPIVPSVMLTGIISASVSKYLPGPGSHILKQEIEFIQPVYYYETIHFIFEVIEVNDEENNVEITVVGENDNKQIAIKGKMNIRPPYRLKNLESTLSGIH